MSIYTKQINSLDYSDILSLLEEGSKENIRLEFKREYPSKDEMLKKISSFSNTWGGYVVIGVEQDENGKASQLLGVDPKLGFQQQVIEWCYGGIYPPISPMVSPPIKKEGDLDKVFYVIYISESYDAPHFLNGRRGCYVRTDEFSQLFEPRLATYDEIMRLSNRRELSIRNRENLIARAKARFDTHVKQSYATYQNVIGDIDITLWLAVVPTFPKIASSDVTLLDRAVHNVHMRARDNIFPLGEPNAQLDGFYFPDPRGTNFAYLEVDTHGLVFYSQELGYITDEASRKLNAANSTYTLMPSDIYIYSSWVIAWIVFYLKYANRIYKDIGYDGSLTVRVGLERIRDRRLRIPRNKRGDRFETGVPLLDENMSVEKTLSTLEIESDLISTCKDLFKAITFACGWKNAYSADEEFINFQIDQALDYLMWNRQDLQ